MRKLASWTLSVFFLLCLSALPAAAAPAGPESQQDRSVVSAWFDGWMERILSWAGADGTQDPDPEDGQDDECGCTTPDTDDEGSGSVDPDG